MCRFVDVSENGHGLVAADLRLAEVLPVGVLFLDIVRVHESHHDRLGEFFPQ